MSGIDQKIMQRIKAATGNFDEAVEVFQTIMPVLEKGVKSRPDVIRLIQEVNNYLTEEQAEESIMLGKMKEVAPSLEQAKYDWVHLDMLNRAREYFQMGDVETVKNLLAIPEEKVLEDALVLISDERFGVINKVLNNAMERRLKLQ